MQSPTGMTKSTLLSGPGLTERHVDVVWIPRLSQIGVQILCFSVIDSAFTSSDQICINLVVTSNFPSSPKIVPGSNYPTGLIIPESLAWMVEFDHSLARPKRSAYIRFYNSSDDEVYRLAVMTSPNVTFTDVNTSVVVTFTVDYRFAEYQTYYILLDSGLVADNGQCGKQSLGIMNHSFWRVTIQPFITTRLTIIAEFSTDNTYPATTPIQSSPTNVVQEQSSSTKSETAKV